MVNTMDFTLFWKFNEQIVYFNVYTCDFGHGWSPKNCFGKN